MTDAETRVVRTNGFVSEFQSGVDDLVITPEGVDVTEDQYKQLRDVAFASHITLHLDEEFPAPQGKDAVLDVPAPAAPGPSDPTLGGGGKAAPQPVDSNGGSK
jgi:hypothetical protein